MRRHIKLLVGIVYITGAWLSAQPSRATHASSDGYVDSHLCANCHQAVWESYQRTGMGRSFYRPASQNMSEDWARNTYYHQASDTYFAMIRRDRRYFQRQYQIGLDGHETNTLEKEIDFVVGSGNHSKTYLHRASANTLVELPLAWYAEKGGYFAMNPGYDRPDHQGFRRLIGYECMFCHNAYPEIAFENWQTGSDPVFSKISEGIDCQRCHGPGEKHIRLARTPSARREEVRGAIVNPARLPFDRQMEVCMQCHLETTSFPLPNSIVRYERAPFSYRPGEPLADFVLHFDQSPGKAQDDKFEIAGAAYRLRKSACFEKSNGAMQCTTCHNPHEAQQGESAAKHYIAVCRHCHGSPLDRLIAAGKHTSSPDCIGCHMPKRRTDDVVHVVMTDHYIQRLKPARDLLADLPERPLNAATAYRGEVVLYYPAKLPKPEDDLYVALAQVIQKSNLEQGMSQLSNAIEKYRPESATYYLRLADALRDSGKPAQAIPIYNEALKRQPGSLAALQGLSVSLISTRQQQAAADLLKKHLDSDRRNATTWDLLGSAYTQLGRTDDAVAAFERATEVNPEMPEAYNSLGGIWFEKGDAKRAEPALREAVRLDPNYAEARNNLANLLSTSDRFEEAQVHFKAALRSKPDDSGARYDYAAALARVHRLGDARAQLETLLQLRPNASDAHELLGTVLAAQGQLQPAIEHYREAIRIQPEFSRALLHLGQALVDSGQRSEALPYLRKAAVSSDAAIREEAFKILERVEKGK